MNKINHENTNPPCERCQKPTSRCVCEHLVSIRTKTRLLILQHPQEPKEILSTAKITTEILENSRLQIGLSWPNLDKAWNKGHEKPEKLEPKKWGVLYLGTKVQKKQTQSGSGLPTKPPILQVVDRKGAALPNGSALLKNIEGIVVLDGTWQQAKALWWRNAWLLKLNRLILTPERPSLYMITRSRKEPRRECLSTIESVGLTFSTLGESPKAENQLLTAFKALLKKPE